METKGPLKQLVFWSLERFSKLLRKMVLLADCTGSYACKHAAFKWKRENLHKSHIFFSKQKIGKSDFSFTHFLP